MTKKFVATIDLSVLDGPISSLEQRVINEVHSVRNLEDGWAQDISLDIDNWGDGTVDVNVFVKEQS